MDYTNTSFIYLYLHTIWPGTSLGPCNQYIWGKGKGRPTDNKVLNK